MSENFSGDFGVGCKTNYSVAQKNFFTAVETRFLGNFMNSLSSRGRVHSVFEHSLNVVLGDSMITFHCDQEAGVPDSVVLYPAYFEAMRGIPAGSDVFFEGGDFIFTKAQVSLRSARNFENFFSKSIEPVCKDVVLRRIGFLDFKHRLPERTESFFIKLFNSFGDIATRNLILEKLIGLGSGLTPSADDAILGISAVAEFCRLGGREVALNFSDDVYEISENRTTDVSRKYFACASHGRFSAPLLKTVSSLLSPESEFDFIAYEKLLESGHTSGRDIFRGVCLATEFLF